jgi:hypothetical protein
MYGKISYRSCGTVKEYWGMGTTRVSVLRGLQGNGTRAFQFGLLAHSEIKTPVTHGLSDDDGISLSLDMFRLTISDCPNSSGEL